MLKKYYLGGVFRRPYRTNGIKTRLGSPVLMHSLFVMDIVLRHVFTENLQTQTFTFIGTSLLQYSGNAAL